jgi:hypothetical protein
MVGYSHKVRQGIKDSLKQIKSMAKEHVGMLQDKFIVEVGWMVKEMVMDLLLNLTGHSS